MRNLSMILKKIYRTPNAPPHRHSVRNPIEIRQAGGFANSNIRFSLAKPHRLKKWSNISMIIFSHCKDWKQIIKTSCKNYSAVLEATLVR